MDIKKEFTAGKSLDEIKKDFFEEKEKKLYYAHKKDFSGNKEEKQKHIKNFFLNVLEKLKTLNTPFSIVKNENNERFEVQFSNCLIALYNPQKALINFSNISISWYIYHWEISAVAKLILTFNEVSPQWQQEWQALEKEYKKLEKISQIGKINIGTLIQEKLKTIDIDYTLENYPTKILLKVKMGYKKMLEISFKHKISAEEINQLFDLIETLPPLLQTAKGAINISTYGNNINWIKNNKNESEN